MGWFADNKELAIAVIGGVALVSVILGAFTGSDTTHQVLIGCITAIAGLADGGSGGPKTQGP